MEFAFYFLAGVAITALVSFFILKAAKSKAENSFIEEQTRLKSDLDHANERVAKLENDVKEAKADGESQREKAIDENNKAHEKAINDLKTLFNETIEKEKSRLKSDMKDDTDEILKTKQEELSKSNTQSIGEIVKPLIDNIDALKKVIADESKDHAEKSGEMKEQIRNLLEQSNATRKSAEELTNALTHRAKVQGNWGEVVLAELLTSQGLKEKIHFDVQYTLQDANGNTIKTEERSSMRPDVVLHLDNIREIIIDSKVSLTAYTNYVNAENETDRKRFLAEHIASIRKHVIELSDKDYSKYIQSPKVSAGYVIMFVPTIGALWTALNAVPTLWREAADKGVYIADEQSLYGAIKMVQITWTQIEQTKNHEKVYSLADEMVKRVGMFVAQYNVLGTALKNAVKAYTEGSKKLAPQGQSIITTANQLIDLGSKTDTKYPVKGLIDIDDVADVKLLPTPDTISASAKEIAATADDSEDAISGNE